MVADKNLETHGYELVAQEAPAISVPEKIKFLTLDYVIRYLRKIFYLKQSVQQIKEALQLTIRNWVRTTFHSS